MALLVALVLCLLLLPATFLAIGLRQSTEPWFFTNDSTYQIELAGDLILDGENPYGHDYTSSGLERFYSFDGTVEAETQGQVALRHFAYFPGTPLTSAAGACSRAVRRLSAPRAAATLGPRSSSCLPGPLPCEARGRRRVGGNPLAVHAEWFGDADTPSIVSSCSPGACVRSRSVGSGRVLWRRGAASSSSRSSPCRSSAALLLPRCASEEDALAARRLTPPSSRRPRPFLVADAGALWDDTIAYGAETYRIIGYGLAGILLEGA